MNASSAFSPEIVCRPALPMDTPQVLELSSHIWEGQDYIPYVWEAWLADPNGLLAVAEYGSQIVGLAKLTYLSPGEWWLEGLRVRPEFEGRGIASHLNDYLLAVWRQSGGGIVRFATHAERVKVQTLSTHRGFVKIGEYSPYAAPAIQEPVGSFSPLLPVDLPAALDFVLSSPLLPLQNGLMDHGWRWGRPSSEGLQAALDAGRAWWWKGRRGLVAFWEDEDQSRKYLVMHLVACEPEELPECLLDYRRLAARLGYAHVEWTLPLHPELLALVKQAGFSPSWDEVLYLFEKK